MKLESLKKFLDQPGINVSGICQEAGVSRETITKVLSGRRNLTQDTINKLEPVLIKYGFSASE